MNLYTELTKSDCKPVKQPEMAKLYTLLYNRQIIINRAAYPICNGRKTELLRTGNYQKRLFTIQRVL